MDFCVKIKTSVTKYLVIPMPLVSIFQGLLTVLACSDFLAMARFVKMKMNVNMSRVILILLVPTLMALTFALA